MSDGGLLRTGSGYQHEQTLKEWFHNLQLQSNFSCCQRGGRTSSTLPSTVPLCPVPEAALHACLTQHWTPSENEPHRKLPVGSDQHTLTQGAGPATSAVACHWIVMSSKTSAAPTEANDTLESQQKLSHRFNCLEIWKILPLKQLCYHHRCLNFRRREHTQEQHCWRSTAQGSWGRTGSRAVCSRQTL